MHDVCRYANLSSMNREQLLQRIESAWEALGESYAGLAAAELTEPGVVESWSVKDLIAHVTTWEQEALKYLPLLMAGGRPPRYADSGGIDAFNARMTEQKRTLSLGDVLQQRDKTHLRLTAFLQTVPEEHFTRETRFRHRLRLESTNHYQLHAAAIREWRARREREAR